jgi:hypothetical protein
MTTATLTQDVQTETEGQDGELQIATEQFDIARHDAIITVVSPRTGDHRTFKVSTVSKGSLAGKRILSLLTGSNNESDYTGFAFITQGEQGDRLPAGVLLLWKRFRGQDGERSMWERLADLVQRPTYWESRGVTYQFSLRCRRCGRTLTHPESLASGLGPVCEGRASGYERDVEEQGAYYRAS